MVHSFIRIRSAAAMLMLAGLLLGLGGCQNKPTEKSISYVNPATGRDLIKGKGTLLNLGGKNRGVWVDARTEADYHAGHIPGAISLPYEHVSTDHSILKDYDVIIVYGNEYNDVRARGMSKRLMALGYEDVRTLNGGIRAWTADGNELEK